MWMSNHYVVPETNIPLYANCNLKLIIIIEKTTWQKVFFFFLRQNFPKFKNFLEWRSSTVLWGKCHFAWKQTKKHQMHNDYSKEKKATGLPPLNQRRLWGRGEKKYD